MASCSCCRKPRYQRLIDGLFPSEIEGDINRNNLDQLLFLAKSSPSQLDDIGLYLNVKLRKFVRLSRLNLIAHCTAAMVELVRASDRRTVSLLVRSTLSMLSILLDSQNSQLHVLAANTFLAFAEMPEERASYHLEYDFVIDRFGSLALPPSRPKQSNGEVREKALACLASLIVKVSRDKLYQVNIWDDSNLNKIIPAYLYHDKEMGGSRARNGQGSYLAKLIQISEVSHYPVVMETIFHHFDNHHYWIGECHYVMVVMESVAKATEVQLQQLMVEALLKHLRTHALNTLVATAIVQVLGHLVTMVTEGIVGPYLTDFLKSVVLYLKTHVSRVQSSNENKAAMEAFERELITVINALGTSVPNYEKWNIICFLINEIPEVITVQSDHHLSRKILSCCKVIMQSIELKSLDNTFTPQVTKAMKKLCKLTTPELLLLAVDLWTYAVDINCNVSKVPLTTIWDSLEEVHLKPAHSSSYTFTNEYLKDFTHNIADMIVSLPWERQHMEAYYRFLVILPLALGMEAGECLVAMAIELQDGCLNGSANVCSQFVHVCVSGLLNSLKASAEEESGWSEHIKEVTELRRIKCDYLLPDGFFYMTDLLNIRDIGTVERVLLYDADRLKLPRQSNLHRLPSISMYDSSERHESTTKSVILLSPGLADDDAILSFADMRESGQQENSTEHGDTVNSNSFENVLSNEALLVHNQIADMLTNALVTGDDTTQEHIELPEIH